MTTDFVFDALEQGLYALQHRNSDPPIGVHNTSAFAKPSAYTHRTAISPADAGANYHNRLGKPADEAFPR